MTPPLFVADEPHRAAAAALAAGSPVRSSRCDEPSYRSRSCRLDNHASLTFAGQPHALRVDHHRFDVRAVRYVDRATVSNAIDRRRNRAESVDTTTRHRNASIRIGSDSDFIYFGCKELGAAHRVTMRPLLSTVDPACWAARLNSGSMTSSPGK